MRILIYILLVISSSIIAQSLSKSAADNFIHSLLYEPGKLSSFVLPEELAISRRLGINYTGINNKFLISNDLDSAVRSDLMSGLSHLIINVEDLKEGYSKITLGLSGNNYTKDYYFKDSFLVSAPWYYSRTWKIIESRYFIFHISDPTLFNDYCKEELDKYVIKISDLLKYKPDDLSLLEKNKIHYFFCKNEQEIKNLTNYNTMGMYYLPYDYVITTYNCHYHELLHLLMNFKLRTLPLYTLPFYQEGFAVAFGGRGGKDPNVILNMGLYLQRSGSLSFNEILTKENFMSMDASMTYPVSGLYNKFLLDYLGAEKYLQLYRKYSNTESEINNIQVDTNDLPAAAEYEKFLTYYSSHINIKTDSSINTANYKLIKEGTGYRIYSDAENYLFELNENEKYKSQKYLITADSTEISVYNLYSNNLIAKYVSSFSFPSHEVFKKHGLYLFTVSKKVFDEDNGIF